MGIKDEMRIKEYNPIDDRQAFSRIKDVYGEPTDVKSIYGSITQITYLIEGVVFEFFNSNHSIIFPRLFGEDDEKLKNAETNLSKKAKLELRIKTEKSD